VIETLTPSRPWQGLRRHAARLNLRARLLWRAYPRETIGLGVLALAVSAAIGGAAHSSPELPSRTAGLTQPPAPPPLLVQQIAPERAVQVNQGIPLASGPNPPAKPFLFKGDEAARVRALECLASAVYYEAGQESDDGQRAVAQVVLNRVRHPAFPASVCSVVYQGSTRPTGCQFTFTCDGSLYRQAEASGWKRAWRVAAAALSGYVHSPVGWATHYHANYVVPYWAPTLAKNAIIGAHIFYRWAGGWGRPAAFTKSYSKFEPSVAALRSAALAAEAATAGQASEQVAEVVGEIPGAELKRAEAGRVAIRFNLAAARKAVEEAPHQEYVAKFEASDNLKWSLSSDVVAAGEKPLGKPKPATSGGAAAGAGGGAASPQH
jgi:spore germination cell wall hydrolase CwlJ-like protein